MPNKKKHKKEAKKIAGTTAFATYLLDYINVSNQYRQAGINPPKLNLLEMVGVTLLGREIGGVTGLLPDKLEPATNPHHRKTMHSVMTGLVLTGTTVANQKKMPRIMRSLVNAGSAGYLNHLALDAQTPMGLPLV